MGKALRSKWGLLALVAAMVVGMATIPAVGEHSPESSEILRLHMGADGNYFQHEAADGSVIKTESFSPQSNCRLNVDNELVTLSGSSSPGYHNQSIGVRGSGGNGVPCSRVDSSESLTVSLNGALTALAVELDLELKGTTEVLIELSNGETYTLNSGGGESGSAAVTLDSSNTTANCRGASDSGPDSGPNDNCRVTVHPDSAFTSITFTPSAGEMSLEGGGDFYPYDPANDTIFYLETWDGVLDCGDTASDDQGGTDVSIKRYQNIDDPNTPEDEGSVVCEPKLYRLDAVDVEDGEDTVTFELSDPDQVALYRATLTFERDTSGLFNAVLLYDPDGSDGYEDFDPMPACLSDPGNQGADTQNESVIPSGDQGCIISVVQQYDGTTTWDVLFYGDWRFK